ncbi:hypothetical protein [Uliginosibacterium gangwonense]|uniref:hypothetical protein n=1 Tax=Uliginosibacterium gangwonense TaxID=392736 RepID=UPI0012FA2E6E|nr:hypothetical protein [Uliginosibacterium gangwonense]
MPENAIVARIYRFNGAIYDKSKPQKLTAQWLCFEKKSTTTRKKEGNTEGISGHWDFKPPNNVQSRGCSKAPKRLATNIHIMVR